MSHVSAWPLFPASSGDDCRYIGLANTELLGDVSMRHCSSKGSDFRHFLSGDNRVSVLVLCVSQWFKMVGPHTRFLFAAVVQFVSGWHWPVLAFPVDDMSCSVPPIDTYHHVSAAMDYPATRYPARSVKAAILSHIIWASSPVSVSSNEANRLSFDVTMPRHRCSRNVRLATATTLTKTFRDSIVGLHSVPPDWVSRTGRLPPRRCFSLPQLYPIGGL